MKATITTAVSFLKSHILGIVAVGIFCSVAASFIYSWIQPSQSSPVSPHTRSLPTDKIDADVRPRSQVQTAPLPEEIVAEIASRPPLQQGEIAANYVGQRFRWRVTLETAETERVSTTGLVRLLFLDRGEVPWVVCELSVAAYPSLKTVKKGTEFYITGTVTNVAHGTISLSDAILE